MEWIEYSFNQRALLTAFLVGLVNGYLGGYVLLRRSSLFASALSHTLFPGIALGALVAGLSPLSAFIGALVAAMVIGLSAQAISLFSRVDHNTTLAILFTAAFGGGLLILDSLQLYISIEEYLFGDILGLSNSDLWFVYLGGGFVMAVLLLFQRPLLVFLLSPEMARSQGIPVKRMDFLLAFLIILTMVLSMQAVGLILTIGLMISPPTIIYLYSDQPSKVFWGGGIIGALVSTASVALTNWLNWQTGATIVLLLGILFVLAFLASPRYGLLGRLRAGHTPDHA
jgi:manganese/iron transport system permease protein/iron/zinc/copper transport system permease protein